jgi:hypothetical protein
MGVITISTTSGLTVFKLGSHADGNRQIHIVKDAQEYTLDADTIIEYSDASVAFPYSE